MLSDHYVRVWCAPCEERITFPGDGAQAVSHANRHGAVIAWSEDDGIYIGQPQPVHTPTPPITADEVLDYEDMPITVMSAMFRETMKEALR